MYLSHPFKEHDYNALLQIKFAGGHFEGRSDCAS